MIKDEIINKYKNHIITWCNKNNAKITDITAENKDLYPKINALISMFNFMDYNTKQELTSYGMPWPDEILEKIPKKMLETLSIKPKSKDINDRIKNELVPYLQLNLIKIPAIPSCINGKHNPMYSLMQYIIKHKDDGTLSEESIQILNSYDMPWFSKRKKKYEERILDELIPYCVQNNCLIYQISRCDELGNVRPLYKLISNLRYKLQHNQCRDFAASTLKLLEDYQINKKEDVFVEEENYTKPTQPTQTVQFTNKTLTDKALKKELKVHVDAIIKWMDKRLAYIHNITPNSSCWDDLQFVNKYHYLLSDIDYEDLRLYGFSRPTPLNTQPTENPKLKANIINRMITSSTKLDISEQNRKLYAKLRKIDTKIKKIITWLNDNSAFISDITTDDPVYKDLEYINTNYNLLDDDQIEELTLYGYDASVNKNNA